MEGGRGGYGGTGYHIPKWPSRQMPAAGTAAIMRPMSAWQTNLHALHLTAPAVAELVTRMPRPEGFEPVTGTDGTPTFLRKATDSDGRPRLEWLGSTSMPRASAEALVSTLDPSGQSANGAGGGLGGAGGGGAGGANGLGLSIGTGYEWAAFVGRLGAAQALYVYEPSPALRLALEICDLSSLLAARKIVLLAGTPDQAGALLVQWLNDHLGMEPPTVLHPLPTAGGGGMGNAERRNALLTAGEAIVRQAVTHRQGQLASITHRLLAAAAQASASPATPVEFALLLTPRYPEERPLHARLPPGAGSLIIDRPDTTSLALRMERLAASLERGPVRVVSDLFRPTLGGVPPQVAVETWVPPLVGPGFWNRLPAVGEWAPVDRVVVHAEDHRLRLLAHGFSADQVHLRPLTLRPATSLPESPAAGGREGGVLRHRVALIGDLPRLSMEALEIVLPTHQAIYTAARDLIAEDYLTAHAGAAPDLLRRALARAGVGKTDPSLPMLRLVRDLLVPYIPLLALARALLDGGMSVSLLGDWPEWDPGKTGQSRLVPFAVPPAQRWAEVAVLVHLSPTGTLSPLVGEAIASGIPLVAPEHPADALPGSLATLLSPNLQYLRPRPAQLLTAIRGLLGDAPRRQALATAAQRALAD